MAWATVVRANLRFGGGHHIIGPVDWRQIEAHTPIVDALRRGPRRGHARVMLLGLVSLAGIAACGQPTASSSGSLPVSVTVVTGTFTPYNPRLSQEGVPAEEVDFTVGGAPLGSFVCNIEVQHAGHEVGHTSLAASPPTGHPRTVHESVAVAISGATFTGTPADAQITCDRSSTVGLSGTTTTTTRPVTTTTTGSSPGTVPSPTSATGQPPPQAGPAQTEVVHNAIGAVCTVPKRPGSSANAPQAPPSLPGDPVAVDAVRIPGLNDKACQSGAVTASRAIADQLAADVDNTQRVPTGVAYSCPSDDGHGVVLMFRYASPSEAIAIWVAFGGCRFISGLATSRWTSSAVGDDLNRFVPQTWF